MSVGEFITTVGDAIKGAATKVVEAIAGASLVNVLKFGVLAGVSIATVVMIFKFIKAKRAMYNNEENKTIVDRALQNNYADVRNQKELHPLMKKVRKNLQKDLQPRVKKAKKVKKNRNQYREFINNLYYDNDDDYFDVMSELEMFCREMDENNRIRRAREKSDRYPYGNHSIKAIWDY